MIKKNIFVILFLVLLIPSVIASEFWASKKSNKYHYPDCRWAQKIKSENLIKFKSPEDAQKAGYIPCKVCTPPTASKSEINEHNKLNFVSLQLNGNNQDAVVVPGMVAYEVVTIQRGEYYIATTH